MEILGLDKIKKESDTVNLTGLDKIRQIFHNDLPKMSPFAVELTRLVGRLRELDTDFEEFGAKEHQYQFAPVVPLSRVRDFEKRHQFQLPQGYVAFLTQVGNGGAGPANGFFSLEECRHYGNWLMIASYGCGGFCVLTRDGRVGYWNVDSSEEPSVEDITFEAYALNWAKDTIKKYE